MMSKDETPDTKPKEVESTNIRVSGDRIERYKQEAAALTEVTGTRWTVSAYMRFAADRMLGKHPMLAKPGE